MSKIGFIGMGNMGYAIMSKLSQTYEKADLLFTDINVDKCEEVSKELGVKFVRSNLELAKEADFILLAVKPQFLDVVLEDIKPAMNEKKILLSIVAGVPISKFEAAVGAVKVVRAMPNTPALIGEGMTGIAYDESKFSNEEKQVIDVFFSSYGRYKKLGENLMNVVTCVSGSSPAYVYMFIEALADSAVKYGMPRDLAYEFAAQAVMGSAKMVLEGHEHPAVLKDRVCSPAGTTIAGVAALEDEGFRNAIFKATDACYEKGVSFSK